MKRLILEYILQFFKNTNFFLFFILFIALIIRIFTLLYLEDGRYFSNKDDSDLGYEFSHQFTWQLSKPVSWVAEYGIHGDRGDGLAKYTPFYPIIIDLSYRFTGGVMAVRIFNVIVSTLTCLIIYLLGKELNAEMAGKIGAFLYTFYKPAIVYVPMMDMETFQIFGTALSVLFFIWAYKKNTYKAHLVSAIIFMSSIMIKPAHLHFILVFFVLLWVKNRGQIRKILSYLFCYLIISFIFIFPWTIRNYRIYHAFVPLSTQGGFHLRSGNSVHFNGGAGGWLGGHPDSITGKLKGKSYTRYPELKDVSLPLPKVRNIAIDDKYQFRLAAMFIKRYPSIFLELIPLKFYNMWRFNYEGNRDPIRIISEFLCYLLMVPFFLFIGIYYLIPKNFARQGNEVTIPLLFVIMHVIIFVIYPGMIRYRLPLIPIIITTGLYGIDFIFDNFLFEKR